PTNVSPSDGGVLATGAVTLDWTDAIDDTPCGQSILGGSVIASYDVEVATDAGFVGIVFSATVVPSTATTTALGAGTYFWHARATDGGGNTGPFSATTSFTCIVPV